MGKRLRTYQINLGIWYYDIESDEEGLFPDEEKILADLVQQVEQGLENCGGFQARVSEAIITDEYDEEEAQAPHA